MKSNMHTTQNSANPQIRQFALAMLFLPLKCVPAHHYWILRALVISLESIPPQNRTTIAFDSPDLHASEGYVYYRIIEYGLQSRRAAETAETEIIQAHSPWAKANSILVTTNSVLTRTGHNVRVAGSERIRRAGGEMKFRVAHFALFHNKIGRL